MPDRTFPHAASPDPLRPEPIERVDPRAPLAPICEVLSISIHDIVNSPRCKHLVREFYRVSRWIENDTWLRRQIERLGP